MKIGHLFVAGAAMFSVGTLAIAQQQEKSAQQDRGAQRKQVSSSGMPAGMSSATVRETQQALRQMGHDPGPADGQWGPKTRRALTAFQQERGLQASGRLDQSTLAALNVPGSESIAGAGQPGGESAAGASSRQEGGASAGASGRSQAGTEPGQAAAPSGQPGAQPSQETESKLPRQ